MASLRRDALITALICLLLADSCISGYLRVTVAKDGSGHFKTIGEAVEFAPARSSARTEIIVREGVYEESLKVPAEKENIFLIGDGSGKTIISGNRSAAGGWSTLASATVGIQGSGFAAFDLTIRNTAGAWNGQAVALLVQADRAVFHRCIIDGNQDTLFARTGRQFYRDCEIRGTVDFIFGDATAVFENSLIRPGGTRGGTITAQSRRKKSSPSAFSFHKCIVKATDVAVPLESFYLGRPWRSYARVVFMRSSMEDVINPAGWVAWDGAGRDVPETVFYAEFENEGPGADDGRRRWKGVNRLTKKEASLFSVRSLIHGDGWIPATGVPFDSNI